MSLKTLTDQVRLMLAELAVEYDVQSGYLARIQYGSADITVEIAENPSAVAVRARVLREVEASEPDDELRVLRSVNDRNGRSRFGKFYFDRERGDITLEYEILGGYLQPQELLNALQAVATTADDHDDLLMEELGTGKRASDLVGRPEAPSPFDV